MIQQTNIHDNGTYFCQAENKAARSVSNFTLHVTDGVDTPTILQVSHIITNKRYKVQIVTFASSQKSTLLEFFFLKYNYISTDLIHFISVWNLFRLDFSSGPLAVQYSWSICKLRSQNFFCTIFGLTEQDVLYIFLTKCWLHIFFPCCKCIFTYYYVILHFFA